MPQRTHGEPAHADRDNALGTLGATEGAPRSWKVGGVDAPRAWWVTMTTIDGVASARPSALACSTVGPLAQVPLHDQRRNCDHTHNRSRLASSEICTAEICTAEQAGTAVAVLHRAGMRHARTRPYRPQTDGEIERSHRTLTDGWTYARLQLDQRTRRSAAGVAAPHRSPTQRSPPPQAGHRRPATGGRPPVPRLANLRRHRIWRCMTL